MFDQTIIYLCFLKKISSVLINLLINTGSFTYIFLIKIQTQNIISCSGFDVGIIISIIN